MIHVFATRDRSINQIHTNLISCEYVSFKIAPWHIVVVKYVCSPRVAVLSSAVAWVYVFCGMECTNFNLLRELQAGVLKWKEDGRDVHVHDV